MSVASLLERLRVSIGLSSNTETNVAIACQGGGSHADRSRLNRHSSFIADPYADGEAEARNFLTDRRAT